MKEILNIEEIEKKSKDIKLTGIIYIIGLIISMGFYLFFEYNMLQKLFLTYIILFIGLILLAYIEKRYWDTKYYMFKYFKWRLPK